MKLHAVALLASTFLTGALVTGCAESIDDVGGDIAASDAGGDTSGDAGADTSSGIDTAPPDTGIEEDTGDPWEDTGDPLEDSGEFPDFGGTDDGGEDGGDDGGDAGDDGGFGGGACTKNEDCGEGSCCDVAKGACGIEFFGSCVSF